MGKASNKDLTPQEMQAPLLAAMIPHIAFDGWSATALKLGAEDLGISAEMAELAFPGGAVDALEMHLQAIDRQLSTALADMDLSSMKIRDRITLALRTRLEQQADNREIVRRTLSAFALPQNIALGPKAVWRTADTIWRAAGDTSTDHNWYTKRMTLSAVYSAVLLYWLNDDSEGYEDTWSFLDRRIEDVMKIEKTKFQIRSASKNMPSLSRFLGHIRFPSL